MCLKRGQLQSTRSSFIENHQDVMKTVGGAKILLNANAPASDWGKVKKVVISNNHVGSMYFH